MTPAVEPTSDARATREEDARACARKLRWLTFGFVVFLALLGATLFAHQVLAGEDVTERLRSQAIRLANVPSERAPLLATGGEVLAYSKPVYRLVLDVAALRHPRERLDLTVARVKGLLADFEQRFDHGMLPLNLSRAAVAERIRASGPLGLVLNEEWDATPIALARYARFATEFPQIRIERTYRRECVAGGPLLNTLGRVGWRAPRPIPQTRLWYARSEMYGLGGIEGAADGLLCGRGGVESVRVDALGFHQIATKHCLAPVCARPVRTTIHLAMQRKAEECFLSDCTAAFLVIEVPNGKVRAVGGTPFAPYAPTPLEFRELASKSKEGLFVDRARSWRFPPGSLFKMIPVAAALASGRLSPDERLVCDGHCDVGPRAARRKCTKAHGPVNAAEALAFSCNSFAHEAAKRAGPENVVLWAKRFGIGADPAPGRHGLGCSPSRVMEKTPWYPGEVYNLAIGKGETVTTLVALGTYGCALATGKLMAPTYVEEADLPEGNPPGSDDREIRDVGLPPEVRRVLFAGMLGCTEMPGGTGRRAACTGLRVLAKTGTAVLTPERKNALMLVLVPAENPKYCIVSVIQDSKLGGGAAVGPRMGRFLEGLLGLGLLSSGTTPGGS